MDSDCGNKTTGSAFDRCKNSISTYIGGLEAMYIGVNDLVLQPLTEEDVIKGCK